MTPDVTSFKCVLKRKLTPLFCMNISCKTVLNMELHELPKYTIADDL
jgi:hypothetical protein